MCYKIKAKSGKFRLFPKSRNTVIFAKSGETALLAKSGKVQRYMQNQVKYSIICKLRSRNLCDTGHIKSNSGSCLYTLLKEAQLTLLKQLYPLRCNNRQM